jgi:oligopeptide/dipeptide ABC transporter ATP-binding protein
MAEPILEAVGLTKSFEPKRHWLYFGADRPRPRPALLDVSLSLAPGEAIGVVGESGSGKSTLARCMALLEQPDAGRVLFAGEDLTALPKAELRRRRRQIQTIFQDPFASLNPTLRVGDALAEVLRFHGRVARDRVQARLGQLLDQVGLPSSAARRYPRDFSGGQRQRICIARALAAEPEVLIADEPVSALDVSVQAQVLNLLIDLREELGLAIVFIGHDLVLVDYFAPRIAVMLGGQIVELLPPACSLKNARHPYTRELLAAVPRLEPVSLHARERVVELAGALPAEGCPFWARCPHRLDARCETETPPLHEVAPGHLVACFYDSPRERDASA